jgi:hypothetical protein
VLSSNVTVRNINVFTRGAMVDGCDPECCNDVYVQGVVESNWAGFTGTGFVNGDNVVGSGVEFTVAGPVTNVAIRYADGTTTNRPMAMSVNATAGPTVNFSGTGAWSTWAVANVPLSLGTGTHKIRLTATTVNGGPNLDKITIS